MIQSMTGFGGSEGKFNGTTFKVEIRSVNQRYCDINVRFPDTLGRLEPTVRNVITNTFARGKFEVFLIQSDSTGDEEVPAINKSTINRYQAILNSLSKEFKEHNVELKLNNTISLSDLYLLAEKTSFKKMDYSNRKLDEILINLVKQSTEDLKKMRLKEGEIISRDIIKRITKLEAMIKKVSRHIPQVVSNMKKHYLAKIKELAGAITLDMNRIHQEVAMMIEKMDVEEELVRLGSHISQLNEKITKGGVVGRTLDFLLQEINREINTIGSKSYDSKISQTVIEMKSEVERIREQVQNIE